MDNFIENYEQQLERLLKVHHLEIRIIPYSEPIKIIFNGGTDVRHVKGVKITNKKISNFFIPLLDDIDVTDQFNDVWETAHTIQDAYYKELNMDYDSKYFKLWDFLEEDQNL